ncbi:MAG: hypothetical protein WBM96_19800 [Polyangiales bacterium]
MTRVLVTTLAACALLLSSCRNNANNVVLASLNRSAKLQFLCADLELIGGNQYTLNALLPAALCDGETVVAPEIQPQFLGAVTQIERGEVAVVNFTGGFIFNTSRTIPGVTAVTVDEQPTGIQISPFQPDYTFVTSFSAKSLQAVPTEALLTGSTDLPTPPPQRFDAGPTDLALQESAQSALITNDDGQVIGAESSVDYRYLYAALPELGAVAQVQVTIDPVSGVQAFGEPVLLPLDIMGCPVSQVPPPDSDGNDYNRICPQDFMDRNDPAARVIKTVTTTQPCSEGPSTGPRPVALTIDRGVEQGSASQSGTGDDTDDVLLVADANQPLIHRFELGPGGAMRLDPIITGTPTSEIDVTPFMPASSARDDQAATQRYLYAVSAIDSSLLVVNYTEDPEGTAEADKTFGAVLPVLAGVLARANEENVESRDRVRFAFSNVRAIEVVSPSYQLEDDANGTGMQVPENAICDPTDGNAFALAQSATNMRGVFLAVSLSDGTMFFLDVYDLNAPCRGGSIPTACTLAETGPDRLASIRRHRERFRFTPATATVVTIDGSPSFQFNSAPGRLDETNGEAQSSDGPKLEFINCPPTTSIDAEGTTRVGSSMINVFGLPSAELICASSQVWSSFSQGWDARWEGLIPNSEGGLGLFADENLDGAEQGNWFQASDVPLCRVGVLGAQPADAALVESYVGDRLVITGDLPPSTRDDLDCQDFQNLMDDLDDRQVWFPILRAFNHELEIGESENTSRYTLAEVRACFPEFTQYQIHTQAAYTVTGTASGFINRVIPGEDEQCVLDPSRPVDLPTVDDNFVDVDTYLAGRAFASKQYINPLVSFQISPFPPDAGDPIPNATVLNFNISNQFGRLVLDTGAGRISLPSSMLFAPQQDELYFVDLEAGVRRIVFSPLNIVQTFQ